MDLTMAARSTLRMRTCVLAVAVAALCISSAVATHAGDEISSRIQKHETQLLNEKLLAAVKPETLERDADGRDNTGVIAGTTVGTVDSENIDMLMGARTVLADSAAAPEAPAQTFEWAGALLTEEDECGRSVQHEYNCTEEACEDLVPGYINYIYFFKCRAYNGGLKFLTVVLFIMWMAFLLHLVETTTNNYFCASLTLAVDILKLSPNVAGVTFLAVGNAACDVIASIAAFSTGVPKVGVGTTVGAGIFVTTAVVAAVSFVADVRLARRSFVRDILFFIVTIVYLLVTTLDGIITVGEAVGFMIIYIVFVAVVASARFVRMFREDKEPSGFSMAGSTGDEGDAAPGAETPSETKAILAAPTYNAAPAPASTAASAAGYGSIPEDELDPRDAREIQERRDMLAALDAARRAAMRAAQQKEASKVAGSKYFAKEATAVAAPIEDEGPHEDGDDEDDDDDEDGDLGGGFGDGGSVSGSRKHSVVDDLPKKPSRWTRQFLKTQHKDGTQYAPFQWSSYHKKQLAKELAARLRARGASTVTTADGNTVDFLELLSRDPKAAAEIAASIGSAVSAAAAKHEGAITYREATAAATTSVMEHGAVAATPGGSHPPTSQPTVVVPVADVIALLPHETIKPIANVYNRVKRVFGVVAPYYHKFMHLAEIPVTAARKLTVPLLHEGTYRRRLICFVMPGCMALFTIILTTHILKGSSTSVGGFPIFLISALVGGVIGGVLHFVLPRKSPAGEEGATQSLLAANHSEAVKPSHDAGHGPDAHGHHHRPWYKKLGIWIAGPNDEPPPKGVIMGVLLVLSFVMALFWLLLIANEIVGVALFLGKAANVPDVVMGLTVLAVGNSINDLAASLTIARDGYASMAVAGAYAGPMFNVLAGIGLPMMIYTVNSPEKQYAIGKDTPLVWASFITLLVSLTVTLIWVPFEGWRLTHRIGRFLCAWFFMFILLVIIMGFGGLSEGDNVTLAG